MQKETWDHQVVYLSTQEKKRQLEEETQKEKEREVELARQRIKDQVGSALSKLPAARCNSGNAQARLESTLERARLSECDGPG